MTHSTHILVYNMTHNIHTITQHDIDHKCHNTQHGTHIKTTYTYNIYTHNRYVNNMYTQII